MEELPLSEQPPGRFRWGRADLVAFAAFFVLTLIFLPIAALLFLRFFRPGAGLQDLSGVEQILLQALMDSLLVGFIFLLVKVLHGQPFLKSIHWRDTGSIAVPFLVSAGAFLALSVLMVSYFLPAPSSSPLESLLETPESIVVFVVFGVAVAPLVEEIIFRGFLFSVLVDVYGDRIAVFLTAFLFALLHVTQLQGNWPAVLLIFVVGYVLTTVRKRSGSMIPSYIMHTAYNGMIFGVSALAAMLEQGS